MLDGIPHDKASNSAFFTLKCAARADSSREWADCDLFGDKNMNPSVQNEVQQAASALRENRVADAIEQLQGVLAQAPDDFSANHMLGVALGQSGRRSEAIARLLKATQLNPGDAAAQTHLGLAYAAADKTDLARIAFQAALRSDPDFLPAQNALAGLPAAMPTVAAVAPSQNAVAPAPVAASSSKKPVKTAKNDAKATKIKATKPKVEIDWVEVTLRILGVVLFATGVYLRFFVRVEGIRIYSFPGTICIVMGVVFLRAGFQGNDWRDSF